MEEGKHELVFGKPEDFIEVMTAVKKHFGIKSRSVAVIKMLEICRDYLAEEK